MVDEKSFEILLLEQNKTKQEWADYLGIHISTLYKKLSKNNTTDFTREEIIKSCQFFGKNEMNTYFFS